MSEYCVNKFGPSGMDSGFSDTKLFEEDSNLETDSVPSDEAIPKSQEMRRQIFDHENDNSHDENRLCNEVNKMQICSQSTSTSDQHVKHSLETDAVPSDEAISKSQKMRRQLSDHENDNSHDEKRLCNEVNKMQISSHSTDDQNVQHKTVAQSKGQNYESGTFTPDLIQKVIREVEDQCHDVNGRQAAAGVAGGGSRNSGTRFSHQPEIEAKVHATPSQTARTTPQASPPPTTNPKVNAATFQTPQVQVPPTPRPIQESASLPLLKPTPQEAPEEDEEHYDVLLLHSEHDQKEAQQFLDIAEKANWKVATPDDFRPAQTKFKSFEVVHKNSSYTVLLLTANFIADVWCEHRYQTALTQSIENPAKKCTVIPIICQYQNLKLPMELSIFTSAKFNNPKIGKILQRCIKVEKRLKREKEAGMTTVNAAPNHVATLKPKDESLSMDAIYHQQRPELQPGTSAAQMISRSCFSKLCVCLDTPNPMGDNWRRLASDVGFSANSGLDQEKSPTAKILECFFQMEIAKQRSKDGILMRLSKVLTGMRRADAVELLLMDGK